MSYRIMTQLGLTKPVLEWAKGLWKEIDLFGKRTAF